MKRESVKVPDLGGASEVEVIEIAVADGAAVAVEQTLITLESDKASMEVPSPFAGTVHGIGVKVGDRVREGDEILVIEIAGEAAAATAAPEMPAATATASEPAPAASGKPAATSAPATPAVGGAVLALLVPDLGGAESVEVIEIPARVGDEVKEGAPLLVLEGDKASMELPAPADGTLLALDIKVGDKVTSGQKLGELRATAAAAAAPVVRKAATVPAPATASVAPAAPAAPAAQVALVDGDAVTAITRVFEKESRLAAGRAPTAEAAPVYAGPAVRQLAREIGITLGEVSGSGPKGRILREDLRAYVKTRLAAPPATALPTLPDVDFAAFGPIETVALSNIQKATVTNMSRSWLNVPHVTQFDHADVTELEAFRDSLKPEMTQRGNKLTPLPFLLLAVARALREHPRFNASLAPDGVNLVLKKYCHVGIAVDTPQGLVVPVIRDVDRKTVWELAAEARELADKARNRKLKLAEMQGACFTISSLGNIGGEGFTPIVNAPEVAILGVSKLALRPVWNGHEFLPRKTLPLSLSYDHRVINGADAGNFLTFLVAVLGDLRRLLL
ncbi:MAG: dihydrolipoyllysine-residue acetyltransferase [Pseudomonadales bacterium]|nr:dihydrolipoyllysine-residue acetyltransferase [Pseudomonadales bacterium]MBP9035969.1 dihydrolipoyllysine-residue acetyltransferase [Pseudomonadales bacterium]